MIRAFVAGYLLLAAVTEAAAQNLPSDAPQMLLKRLESGSCRKLPLGQYTWSYDGNARRPVYYLGQPGREDFETAAYYEKVGVVGIDLIKPIDGGFGSGPMGIFNVTLKFPIDGKMFKQDGKNVCIQISDYSNAGGKVVRTEQVKGGRTNWAGTIAYIQLTGIGCLPPPASFPNVCRNDPRKPRQFRALFREKPFGGGWLILASDVYIEEENRFLGDKVLEALQAD